MNKEFILYDFDGTIYDGDSGVDLVKYAFKKYPKTRRRIPKMIFVALLYILKIIKKEKMKNTLFAFLRDIDDVDKFVSDFWEVHEKKLKKFWLDTKHDRDIIISASGYFWLEPIAKKYKVYDLFATDINKNTGIVTGKNSHGVQKVINFYEKYPNSIILEMYTDSKNDLPLIKEAKKGYLVIKDDLYDYFEYKKNKSKEIINYLIVGVLTTLVNIGTKFLLTSFIFNKENKLDLQIVLVISWIVSIIFAYIANRVIVFKSNNKIVKESISFITSRISTLLIEMLVSFILISLLDFNYYIFTVLIQLMIILLNYIFSKIFVFKKGQ